MPKTIDPKIKTINPKIKTIDPKMPKTIDPKIKTIDPKMPKTIDPKMPKRVFFICGFFIIHLFKMSIILLSSF
jgi:hypothetical protein